MGGNIIGALIFIVAVIAIIFGISQMEQRLAYNNNLKSNIILEAKELKEFSNAAFNYSESFNVPLSATSLTVSNLQKYGLLPNTFPQETPFGQQFVGEYSTDICNPDVMDLLIKTTGAYNSALLSKNGLNATLGINYINSEVDNILEGMNISFINAKNPCVNNGPSFYIGSTVQNTSNFNIYSSGSISTNDNSNNQDAAIYIYAPNQWGYFIFSFEFEFMNDWGITNGNTSTINGTITSQPGEITLSGWNTQCPTGATVISPGNTYQHYYYNANGTFFTNEYCIPAYKSQVNSLIGNYENTRQVLNYPLGSLVYFGNYFIEGTSPSNVYMGNQTNSSSLNSSVEYINPNSINGLNNNIYGVESYFDAYPSYNLIPQNQYPGNNFIPQAPLYNVFATAGIDINVNGVIYQIVTYDYDFITGTGITPTEAGMSNPNDAGQTFPVIDSTSPTIWQDSNGDNLGSSYMNVGGGYSIISNPSNLNNYQGSINYLQYNGGPTDSINFNIPTPQIN